MQGIDVSDGKMKTDEFGFFKKRKEKPLSLGIQCIPMASTYHLQNGSYRTM